MHAVFSSSVFWGRGRCHRRPGSAARAAARRRGSTAQFSGGDAEYDAYVKLASNENNWGPPESVMKAMNNAWKYTNRYGYPDGNIIRRLPSTTA